MPNENNGNSNSGQIKLITLDNLDTYKDHIEEKNIQVTRDEYTNLPSTKLTDGKSYFITDEGVVIKNGTEYGGVSGGNTTYTLSAGTGTDANKIILTPSSGTPDKVTVPYATNSGTVNGKTVEANVPSGAVFTDTTYGLTADTTNNKITLTPSTGSAQSITVPYATSAGNAGTVNSHTVAKDVPSDAKFTDTTYSNATTAVAGLMSTSDKSKLDGVASGAEVNQNAFSNIVANGTTVSADTKTDTLTIEAGSNISITGDATNDKITISATDTTYSDATTASHGLISTNDKIKLNGISSGAEVNQNAFSNVKVGDTTVAADTKTDTLELVAGTNITLTPDATNDKVTITSKDTTYSANNGVGLSGTTFYNSGVRSIAQGTSNGTINVNTNGSTANVAVKGLGSAAYTPSTDYIAASLKGANNGVAELDSTGKVPSSQLPSFVDDVLEYNSSSDFPLTGESGKIYIAKDTNKTYRWSGSAYVEISESLALGETSSTAYRGDRGKTAYDHSQTTGNPHGTTKANVGLGNVANIDQSKAIKSITRSGTTFTATALDGTTSSFTQQDNNTTYGANNGVGLSGTTFYNTGVRAIAEGTTAGTINVNTNGSTADVAVKDAGKAIKSITRSGTTFTATAIDGSTTSFTQQDNNTTYTGANGISLSGTTFSNSGVRSVAAGGSNGTINVNTNGSTANVAVTGLKALAYKDSLGKSDVGLSSVANIDQSKAIKSITRSGTTFTATALDGTTTSFTQQDNNTTYSDATTAASGLMSASDKTKLNGIASGAEVNQNAFSNVVVGSTTIAADGKTDTLTLVAGSNVTLTPDATNDKVTIAATDTNTWRGIQNNLTSDSTSDSLSAAQGKALANGAARDSTKLALAGGTLTGAVEFNNGKMPLAAGKITGLTAGASRVYGDGIAISNPTTANDVGFIRVVGTGESDTVLEICTGDDGGGSTAETIAVRQYNTSGTIAKEAKLLDPSGNTSFPGTVTAASFSGSIANATGLTKSQVTTALGYTPPTTDTNTTYSAGSNITQTGTVFSLTKANVTGALGYTPPTTNTTYSNVSTSAAGLAPKVTDTSKFLKGDGTWSTPTNTTYSNVSSASAGLAPKGAAVSSQSQSTKFLREDGSWAAPSYTTNTNTTYTFANGTNGFTVTPSGGTAQTVTVTPSITNNVTGSGTSGYIAKFNGGNTITNGPAIGSDTTKYLRNDGTWVKPPNDNTWTAMVGATSAANGSVGYVNAVPPKDGYNTKYLRADGTWTVPPGEVNQNAFSNVVVGSTTVAADSKTDTLTLVGSNVTLTPDATNDKVTIGITKANVTSALGYTPPTTNTNTTYSFANGTNGFTVTPSGGSAQTVTVTPNDSTKLPLAGGTMTGQIKLSADGFRTSNDGGYSINQYGNLTALNSATSSGSYFCMSDNGGTARLKMFWTSGNVETTGTVTASGFSGSIANATGLTKSQVTTALGYTPPTTDTNTTYTLSADTTNNQIKLTPSSGSAQSVTVPYATNAGKVNNKTVGVNVPSDAIFTDQRVDQREDSSNTNYSVLLSLGAASASTDALGYTHKNVNFKYNPSTGDLTVPTVNGVDISALNNYHRKVAQSATTGTMKDKLNSIAASFTALSSEEKQRAYIRHDSRIYYVHNVYNARFGTVGMYSSNYMTTYFITLDGTSSVCGALKVPTSGSPTYSDLSSNENNQTCQLWV